MADSGAAGSNPPTMADLVELLSQQFQAQAQQLEAQTRQALAEGQQVQAQAIRELMDTLWSGLGDLREDARQFTDDSCQKETEEKEVEETTEGNEKTNDKAESTEETAKTENKETADKTEKTEKAMESVNKTDEVADKTEKDKKLKEKEEKTEEVTDKDKPEESTEKKEETAEKEKETEKKEKTDAPTSKDCPCPSRGGGEDGMVERFNRTLAQELAKFCGDGQTEWDRKLPLLLMAYRSAEHEATEYTPARLMLGREIRLPVDLVTGRPPDEGLPTVGTRYAAALQERLVEAHHQVRENLHFAAEAMRRHYDRGARVTGHEEGDQVWLHNPRRRKGLSPKLQSPWEGPYTVVERVSEVTYRIRCGPRGRPKVVHLDRLWRYHGPGRYTWGLEQEADDTPSVPGDDDERDTVGLPDQAPGMGRDVDDEEEMSQTTEDDFMEAGADEVSGGMSSPVVGRSSPRPQRNRRKPRRFDDFLLEEAEQSSV